MTASLMRVVDAECRRLARTGWAAVPRVYVMARRRLPLAWVSAGQRASDAAVIRGHDGKS